MGSLLASLCVVMALPGWADTLVGLNGERFVGKVIEETADTVVFESETGGRMIIPRGRIRELQKTPASAATATNTVIAVAVTNAAPSTNSGWLPPGVGKDGFDWLQLKSDEWLKGYLDYVLDKKVQFESDKLEDLSLKLKDVRQIYSGKPMFTKFHGRDQVFGTVVVSNTTVEVFGPEQVTLPRAELTGITPGGERELDFWAAKATLGAAIQSGNTKQSTLNASAELSRRTPATQFLMNYLGNFSETEGTQSANNHRINLSYDVRLNRNWFLRPIQAEYYRDQLANIGQRITAGVGVGYYILDSDDLEWIVAAGPSYQYTRFETVEPGQSDTATTPAATLQTRFKADITSRLTFIQTYSGTLASEQAGLYSHHAVSTLEFEIKRHLELDMSFVWDYLQNPATESSGTVPQRNDFRLTLGVGVKF
jgi:putative salt-induced outer membrane protein YdiY